MTEPAAPYPLPQMTTFELRDYKKSLERALSDRVVGSAPVAADLRRKLDQVMAEQEERQQAARPHHGAPGL